MEAVQKEEGRGLDDSARAGIRAALSGRLTVPEAVMVGMLAETLGLYRRSLESLEKLLEERMLELGLESRLLLLETFPGVTRPMAMTVLAELSCDISRFPTPSALVGWAGLAPESGPPSGPKNQAAAPKGNKHLKEVLSEIAIAASKTAGYFQERYNGMLPRLGHERTIAANSAKALRTMWHLLSRNVPYRENPGESGQAGRGCRAGGDDWPFSDEGQ